MDIISQTLNSFYICHYCLTYKCYNKSDMTKHYNNKKKCCQNNIIDYNESKVLSLAKKYYFSFDINILNIFDLKYIVNNYTNEKNIINSNFKLLDNVKNINNQELIINNKKNIINNHEIIKNEKKNNI
jgi:hypothetical protein